MLALGQLFLTHNNWNLLSNILILYRGFGISCKIALNTDWSQYGFDGRDDVRDIRNVQ